MAGLPAVLFRWQARAGPPDPGRFDFISAQVAARFGVTAGTIRQDPARLPVLPEDQPDWQESLHQTLADGRDHSGDLRLIAADGAVRWYRFWMRREDQGDGDRSVSGLLIDIDDAKQREIELQYAAETNESQASEMVRLAEDLELKRRETERQREELRRLAQTDPLTELANRRHFFDLATREFARSRRRNYPLCVIMLDLDWFKMINDELGHAVGDAVLKATAARLVDGVRLHDRVARIGGEEFAILLPETALEPALQVAERLRAAIAGTPVPLDMAESVQVTASFGVAGMSPEDGVFDSLLSRADAALYRAKQGGRNRVDIMSPAG